MTNFSKVGEGANRPASAIPQSWIFWAAIGAGLSYMIPVLSGASSVVVTAWKGAGVTLFALWAVRNAWQLDGRLLAAVMGLGALGDVVLDSDLVKGGIIFAIGHIVAIYLYSRNRRIALSSSQMGLALLLVPLATYIAWSLPYDRAEAWKAGLYTFFVAAMAAAAWTSRFPRYRTGLGAMMFVVSDLFIFSRHGILEDSILPNLFVWPLYFGGQALIAWGVVDTLTAEAGRREYY